MTKKPVQPPQSGGRPLLSFPGLSQPMPKVAGFDPAALKSDRFAGARPGPAKGRKVPLPGKTRGR